MATIILDVEGEYTEIDQPTGDRVALVDAAERSLATLEFIGDAFLTTTETFCDRLGRTMQRTGSLSA